MCKETEEKCMEKVTKSEQDLETMKMSQLEQEKKYMQLKKEFAKERALRKYIEKKALDDYFQRLDENIKRRKEEEQAKKNSKVFSIVDIQKELSRGKDM